MESKLTKPPARVMSGLRVLSVAGTLPKTLPKLANAVKPFTRVVTFSSPNAVLKELCSSCGEPPSFTFFQLEQLKINKKLNERARLLALQKTQRHSATLVQGGQAEIEAQMTQVLRACPPSKFTTLAAAEAFAAQNCSIVGDIDPSEIVHQLKELRLISTDYTGRVTYALHFEAQSDLLGVLARYSSDSPSSVCDTVIMVPCSSELPWTVGHTGTYACFDNACSKCAASVITLEKLKQAPILVSALKYFQKWGVCCPKTEEKLANALKPLSKVVYYCEPTEILKNVDRALIREKLCVTQKKTFKLSAADMFTQDSDLQETCTYLQKQLLVKTQKRGGSVVYQKQEVNEAAARVRAWLVKQGATTAEGDNSEPMEVEEASPNPQTLPFMGSTYSTKTKLVKEFLQLCISQTEISPEEVVQSLQNVGIVSQHSDGHIMYLTLPEPPTLQMSVQNGIMTERARFEAMLKSKLGVEWGKTTSKVALSKWHNKSPVSAGAKRRRHGKKVYKRIHLS